jgi:predicted small lipoprotein YifL
LIRRDYGPLVSLGTPRRENLQMKTFIVLFALIALAACRQEGPAEKAGRKLDQAGKDVSRSIDQAGKDLSDAAKGKK